MRHAKVVVWTAFAAIFAVLAAYVFWGTWSCDWAPIMPDCPVWHRVGYLNWLGDWWKGFFTRGYLLPEDLLLVWFSPYAVQEFQYCFAAFCAALGLAYYLRGRGAALVPALGAGLLLAFCGYWFSLFSAGHLGWFKWMTYGVFAFGLADRAVRRGKAKNWLLLGATVAWASFCQPDLWLLFSVFTAAYFAWCVIRERAWKAWAPLLKGMGLALAAFVLIGLPSFRNAFAESLKGREKQIAEATAAASAKGAEGAKKADDAEARWIFATNWSMPPEDTLEFFIPRIHGDTSCPMTLALARQRGADVKPYTGRLGRPINAPAGNYRQHSLYVGWVTCILAIFGIVAAFWGRSSPRGGEDAPAPVQTRAAKTDGAAASSPPQSAGIALPVAVGDVTSNFGEVLFFAGAAVVFWLFSMGRFCEPVYRLVYALPFGDALRAPVKWHHLTEFCLCVLAGYGLSAVGGMFAGRVRWIVPAAIALFGAADLARVDRIFCMPIDISVVRGDNAVAAEIARRGGGVAIDLVERGQGMLNWSFLAHDAALTGDPMAKEARFVFLASQQRQQPQLAQYLKALKATPAGTYRVATGRGIRAAAPAESNVELWEIPGRPAPAPAPKPPVDPLVLAIGIVSLLTTLGVSAFALLKARRD